MDIKLGEQIQKFCKKSLLNAGFVDILPINNKYFIGMMGSYKKNKTDGNSHAIVAVLYFESSDFYTIEVTTSGKKQKYEGLNKTNVTIRLKAIYNQLNKATATASASRKFRFSDGQIITASSKEEAIKKYKITSERHPYQNFYKLREPLSDLLKKNHDLSIKLANTSSGEVCPNCGALDFRLNDGDLKFYSHQNGRQAFVHHKCDKCKCEWEANFDLKPTTIDNIIINPKYWQKKTKEEL